MEFPILLSHPYSADINGKMWRLVKSWYQSPTSRVKHNDCLSTPFQISCGMKQGSVLSPSLFHIVMNMLLERMRNSNCGGSLHGYFIGTAVHDDDVRYIAPKNYIYNLHLLHCPNIQSVTSQSSDIHSITADLGLKLNLSKLELIQKHH